MFELTPDLKNETISLRPLIQMDFEGLYACGGDERVWAGHPNINRYQREEFEQWFVNAVKSKSALTVIDNRTAKIIGSARFYFEAIPSDCVAVGYTFLSYEYWGGKTNHQLKSLMFDYAFAYYPSIWFHIAPSNIRSQKAILKLGAEHVKDEVVSLGNGKPACYQFYEISRRQWLKVKSEC